MKKKKIIVKIVKSFINISKKNRNILFFNFKLKKINMNRILKINYELKKNLKKIFFYLKIIN